MGFRRTILCYPQRLSGWLCGQNWFWQKHVSRFTYGTFGANQGSSLHRRRSPHPRKFTGLAEEYRPRSSSDLFVRQLLGRKYCFRYSSWKNWHESCKKSRSAGSGCGFYRVFTRRRSDLRWGAGNPAVRRSKAADRHRPSSLQAGGGAGLWWGN